MKTLVFLNATKPGLYILKVDEFLDNNSDLAEEKNEWLLLLVDDF